MLPQWGITTFAKEQQMSVKGNVTKHRDAAMHLFEKDRGKYYTVPEVEEKTGLPTAAWTSILARMAHRNLAIRRLRDGSKAFEYAAGPRLEWGLKHEGHRLPHRHKNRKERRTAAKAVGVAAIKAVTPVGVAGAGLVVKFGGTAHAITMPEARIIYDDLRTLFGE